jgi:hypothetical protein
MHKENIFDLYNQQNPAPEKAAVPENVVTAEEAKSDPVPAEPETAAEPEAPAPEPEAETAGEEGVENGSE